VRGVTNFNGVSLVLLQLLKVAEQRFVELRIMLFDFRRENGRLNLHFRVTTSSTCIKKERPALTPYQYGLLRGTGKPASQTTSVSVCPDGK
jgi:hypothetical protein